VISIIVPGTKGITVLSTEEHSHYVSLIAEKLAKIAGGATAVPATGFWFSDNSKSLLTETVTVISISVDITNSVKNDVKELAQFLAVTLQQEAIFVSINGISYLVNTAY